VLSMKPTILREILFVMGVATWTAFTVFANLDVTIGRTTPALDTLMYFLSTFFFFSLPTTLMVDITKVIRWTRTQRKYKL